MIKTSEIKALMRRLFVVALFLFSFIFILLSKTESVVVEAANKAVLEVTGPLMQTVEYPARIVHRIYTYFYDISHIYSENKALRDRKSVV